MLYDFAQFGKGDDKVEKRVI